jgi:hypothetical protein
VRPYSSCSGGRAAPISNEIIEQSNCDHEHTNPSQRSTEKLCPRECRVSDLDSPRRYFGGTHSKEAPCG